MCQYENDVASCVLLVSKYDYADKTYTALTFMNESAAVCDALFYSVKSKIGLNTTTT